MHPLTLNEAVELYRRRYSNPDEDSSESAAGVPRERGHHAPLRRAPDTERTAETWLVT